MGKPITVSIVILTVLAIIAMPIYQTSASLGSYGYKPTTVLLGNPETVVCGSLGTVGLPCDTQTVASNPVGNYQPKPIRLNFDIFGSSNTTTTTSDSTTVVNNAKAPKDLLGQKINIVSVPESPDIYELVNGQKHAFPSFAVYYDYGYTLAMIQPITQTQLDKYPRAKLLKVKGDSKVYYLTEGGLIRQIIDTKKVFNFYGDRKEDTITISRKEFNFYPANQYVYQFSPLNRDVFQISANGKRYLTPMAVARLGIRADQIAPVSQAELNSYKILPPLVD